MRICIRRHGVAGPAAPEEISAALAAGRAILRPVPPWERPLTRNPSRRLAVLVDTTSLVPLPPLEARRMSAPSRFAVAAARQALLPAPLLEAERTAVVLGAGFGPSLCTERLLRQVFEEGPEAASPMLFTESVANAPAAQVALRLGLRGPNITITQRQASAVAAVQQGAKEILLGRCDHALVGGVEELTPLLFDILDRFGSLDAEALARPFNKGRSGALAAEGAAVWWLSRFVGEGEDEEPALAYVEAWARAFDPTAPAFGYGAAPELAAGGLSAQLAEQGWHAESIDLVVSGASGGFFADRYEGKLLRAYFGERLPPVVAPCAVLGDQPSAVMVGALHALAGLPFGAPWFTEPDPELGIEPHRGPWHKPSRILMTTAATGGAVYWLGLAAAA